LNRVDWSSQAGQPLRGDLRVPGDKSVSHRALMLSAIAEGTSSIHGFLEGEDTRATAAVLSRLGVRIQTPSAGERVVHGLGLHGLRGASEPLDCGNAGTGMRLLAGLLAGQAFDSELVGDASLSKRPMRRVTDPLTQMGALIETREGLPPLIVRGGQSMRGIRYALPVASAQVKSALLLAGLYSKGVTEIIEPHPTRDYTERMLAAFGWPIDFTPGHAVSTVVMCCTPPMWTCRRTFPRRRFFWSPPASCPVRSCACPRSGSIRGASVCCTRCA
jgi:3-phosphoshikimate 1-carboxyvinyltransferase